MKQLKVQNSARGSLQIGVPYRAKVERKQNTLLEERANLKSEGNVVQQKEFPTLTWEDFQAPPDHSSRFYAHTYWKISYSYSVVIKGSKACVNLNAKCLFEKNRAWVKCEHKSQELLEHEQGHYYIGCLCALMFKKRIRAASFTKANYQDEIKRIFKQTLQEYLTIEKRYDEETHHFKIRDIQEKCDKHTIRKNNELRPYWWI
jgi:hypothetical protein